MKEAFFAIRDGSRRKAKPCAFMRWTAGRGFRIDIQEEASADAVPAFFIPFVKKGDLSLDSESSGQWVGERIPPTGRQNLGEILDAHSLSEYSEVELLRSSRGESSQDSFIVQEIDAESYGKRKVDRASARRKALGKAIKERRVNLGMSQRELADELGISQPALSKIEAGMANITFDLLAEIDDCLSSDEPSFLRIPAANLWTRERSEIKDALRVMDPEHASVYARLVGLLEEHANAQEDAFENSLVGAYYHDLTAKLRERMKESGLDAEIEAELADLSQDISMDECFRLLSALDAIQRECIDAFFSDHQRLFELIALANKVDGSGEYASPLASQLEELDRLIDGADAYLLASRQIDNPHWQKKLNRYEYAVVGLEE